MADTSSLSGFLDDVAKAIRTTKKSSDPIVAKNFDEEIKSIPDAVIQPVKTAVATKEKVTITPDADYKGMASVVIAGVTSSVDENITPENIAEGVVILGTTGTAKVLDTFDATATEKDILLSKTAYVNGKKIAGTLPEHPEGASIFGEAGAESISEDDVGVWVSGHVPTDRVIVRRATPLKIRLDKEQLAEAIGVTADKIGRGYEILDITGNLKSSASYQEKTLEVVKDGTYVIIPDEGYDAITRVTVDVAVTSSTEIQHMPFYLLESDDEGNLWCINNYATIEYSPYSLDIDGNLILTQDDTDTAVYWINENMELEVEVDG
ncbi:MAG: hypothetical protein IKB64_00945 [Paludibacteraceae bacterium]|nr:hypothetical protein [Paludibacteraceae bacterium]